MEQTTKPAVKKEKQAPVIVELNDEAKGHVAAMFEAIENEADIREGVEVELTKATSEAWAVCRDHTFALIKTDKFPFDVTKLALKELARNCKENDMPRGVQYVSNLQRAPKLLCFRNEAGEFAVIPAEMYQATRDTWLKADCWKPILGKQGAKAKEEKAGSGEFESEEAKAEHRASIGQALVEIMDEFAPVHAALAAIPRGIFRDEAVAAALEAIARVQKREQQATGGSR